jgi:hypothetical protein
VTVAASEDILRAAILARVKAAEEHQPREVCAQKQVEIELAIGRLVLAALAVGRPVRDTELGTFGRA